MQGWFVISEIMMNMGYGQASIEESVIQQKFDDIQATYLLLGRRTTDVRVISPHDTLYTLLLH